MIGLAARGRPARTGLGGRRSARVVERNVIVGFRGWRWMLSGFFEPLFYLLSIGVGIGELIGLVEFGGRQFEYRMFVAPGTLAAAAMNGALIDATYNVFEKLKYSKTYDAMLATPMSPSDIALGELAWAVMRGAMYSSMFLGVMVAMGLVESWWAVLVVPTTVVIAFASAGAGLLGSTFMRSWEDFTWITVAYLPMFVFSTTFFPLDTYSRPLQIVVQVLPLYHGVALVRSLVLGHVELGLVVHVGYLLALGTMGYLAAARRFHQLLVT